MMKQEKKLRTIDANPSKETIAFKICKWTAYVVLSPIALIIFFIVFGYLAIQNIITGSNTVLRYVSDIFRSQR